MSCVRVMMLLLCVWCVLPACAPSEDEEDGGTAGGAGSSASQSQAPSSACVFDETTFVNCTGIPGQPVPETVERCEMGACPERSDLLDTGSCRKNFSRNKMRSFAGTCEEYQQAKAAGEISYPTCDVWIELGRGTCSECLQRYCCAESQQGAQEAEMNEYLACQRACYDQIPVKVIEGVDLNYDDRIGCEKQCHESHSAASNALGALRGCQGLECDSECKYSPL